MRKIVIWIGVFALLGSVTVGLLNILKTEEVFGKQTLIVGSHGGDVYELQGRLKFLGYYTGKIDGHFGWRTYWAVRNFQYQFGLKVDGIVGPKTKLKLWKATKNWRPGGAQVKTEKKATPVRSMGGFSANEIKIMANAVYGEARGEPYVGQVAVAAVILNRVESAKFPNTPSGVIFQPGAFTAVADGQIWLTPNAKAKKAVQDAINGWDPTGGAIYYFNPNTATSAWIWSRPQIKRIGKHIFAR
ncbi:spore cortex-lytic enzyme [Microaerobacter geothermalis]|uniref:spore cortex-lytic enzyme n=1 Tax=Microaerobacter geothermalis TaxID=674972 RepID=UPI001F28511C|nr:spore cortex-lytic enzyme [Microaerobacter geothermalis]MCF6092780.1 spore cortex-lytic enzyme [Microaerobacter geothermalis]